MLFEESKAIMLRCAQSIGIYSKSQKVLLQRIEKEGGSEVEEVVGMILHPLHALQLRIHCSEPEKEKENHNAPS